MRAVVATEAGAQVLDQPTPEPKPNEILVRVRAASLNRADLAWLAIKGGHVLGLEWAGDVIETGSEVTRFKAGDRVFCTGNGGFADYAVTDAGRCCPISEGLGYEEASVLSLALQTMHDAIVTNGKLRKGETILISGASSGVGLIGLQIAKLLGAGKVIGTSTNAERRAKLRDFGADLALDPNDASWVQQVMDATDGKGVELIIDQVTGGAFEQTMQTAAVLGRIVNVGRLAGGEGRFDFELHALRRLTYIGVTFRTRSVEEIRTLNDRMLDDLGGAIADGTLRLPIDARYPLEQAAEAFRHMEGNAHFGKIVLTL